MMQKGQLPGRMESRFLPRNKSFRPTIQILDATINLLDENHPFGAVSGGALRITGPLATSSLMKSLAFDRHSVYYKKISVGGYIMDTVDYPWQRPNKKTLYFLVTMLDWGICGWIGTSYRENTVSGLLIQETDRGQNVFQRVGVFEVGDRSSNEEGGGIQMLQEACRSQNGLDDDGPFPEWGKQQTITLI